MISIDYEKIASLIDSSLDTYREDDFVSLLYPNPPKNGNILLQELPDALVIWSNEYKSKSMLEVFTLIFENDPCNVIIPYVETEEKYCAAIALGAEPFPFTVDDADLCKDFGSYLIKKV